MPSENAHTKLPKGNEKDGQSDTNEDKIEKPTKGPSGEWEDDGDIFNDMMRVGRNLHNEKLRAWAITVIEQSLALKKHLESKDMPVKNVIELFEKQMDDLSSQAKKEKYCAEVIVKLRQGASKEKSKNLEAVITDWEWRQSYARRLGKEIAEGLSKNPELLQTVLYQKSFEGLEGKLKELNDPQRKIEVPKYIIEDDSDE